VTTRGKSPVRECRTPGSVRGVLGNRHPYRDRLRSRSNSVLLPGMRCLADSSPKTSNYFHRSIRGQVMESRVRFMIRLLALSMLACVFAACTMVGQPAPDFTVRDMQDHVFSLTNYKGKNIVLVFYIGDTCEPCFQQLGELQRHLVEIRALDAEVIAI